MRAMARREEVQFETGLEAGPVTARELAWPASCGAECVFLGRTRSETHAELGELIQLEYEAYGPMAQRLLAVMARDAAARFGCQAVRLVHAQGVVKLGQASVVIQVAAPHRGEAFDACRYLIDRIKHELPIWKREIWQRGETFVQGCCAHADSSSTSGEHRGEQS
jgi:molybdopterin synthase catalytic subunit